MLFAHPKLVLLAFALSIGSVGLAHANVREDVLTPKDVARIRTVAAAEISIAGRLKSAVALDPSASTTAVPGAALSNGGN